MMAATVLEGIMTTFFDNRRRAQRPCRRFRRESGASFVEVAILVPVLLLPILFAMLNLGRWVFLAIEVSSAAHAGAQYGSLHQSYAANTSQIQQAACLDVPEITPCPSSSGLRVTVSNTCYCANSPSSAVTCNSNSCAIQVDNLTVTTSGTFSPMFPFPPFTKSLALTGQAEMTVGQY